MIDDCQMSTVLAPAPLLTHDVGVAATRQRRQFTLAYKKEILRAAERCTAPGEIAGLLRRKGLYSSRLATWRKENKRGALPDHQELLSNSAVAIPMHQVMHRRCERRRTPG